MTAKNNNFSISAETDINKRLSKIKDARETSSSNIASQRITKVNSPTNSYYRYKLGYQEGRSQFSVREVSKVSSPSRSELHERLYKQHEQSMKQKEELYYHTSEIKEIERCTFKPNTKKGGDTSRQTLKHYRS